jgi:hypothetical protein
MSAIQFSGNSLLLPAKNRESGFLRANGIRQAEERRGAMFVDSRLRLSTVSVAIDLKIDGELNRHEVEKNLEKFRHH